MVGTIVSLADEEKEWLDRRSRQEGVPMAEVVRRAVRRLREETEREESSLDVLLERTAGIWPGDDGLAHQIRARDEWER